MIKSNLKMYLAKNKITNKEVAEKLEKTPQQVSNWVTGRSFPNLEDSLILSEMLGVTVNELFELEKEEPLD